MRTRVMILGASVIAGLVGMVILMQYVKSAEQRALAGEQVIDVLVLDADVPMGTPIDELRTKVRVEQVPTKVRADGNVGSLERLDSLGELVTTSDMVSGEQLVESRLGDPLLGRTAPRIVPVPDGMLELNLRLSAERAFGGLVMAGDTVGVLASFPSSDDTDRIDPVTGLAVESTGPGLPDATRLMLDKVLVTRVHYEEPPVDGDSDTVGAVVSEQLAASSQAAVGGDVAVTLALDPHDAQRVVFAAEFGTVWLAHQPEDAAVNGPDTMTRADVFAIRTDGGAQ